MGPNLEQSFARRSLALAVISRRSVGSLPHPRGSRIVARLHGVQKYGLDGKVRSTKHGSRLDMSHYYVCMQKCSCECQKSFPHACPSLSG